MTKIFFLASVGAGIAFLLYALFYQSRHWTPRGVTPKAEVEEMKKRYVWVKHLALPRFFARAAFWILLAAAAGFAIYRYVPYVKLPQMQRISVGAMPVLDWLIPLLIGTSVIYGIGACLGKEYGGKVRKIVGIVAIFGIGLGALAWYEGMPLTMRVVAPVAFVPPAPTTRCPLFSKSEAHECLLDGRWTVLTTHEYMPIPGSYQFCVDKSADLYEARQIGPDAFKVRAKSGVLPIRYRLLSVRACPAHLA